MDLLDLTDSDDDSVATDEDPYGFDNDNIYSSAIKIMLGISETNSHE